MFRQNVVVQRLAIEIKVIRLVNKLKFVYYKRNDLQIMIH